MSGSKPSTIMASSSSSVLGKRGKGKKTLAETLSDDDSEYEEVSEASSCIRYPRAPVWKRARVIYRSPPLMRQPVKAKRGGKGKKKLSEPLSEEDSEYEEVRCPEDPVHCEVPPLFHGVESPFRAMSAKDALDVIM
jgi:hypothetical protein